MAFTEDERAALLLLRGIGPTVLLRLQQLGLDDVTALAEADVDAVVRLAAGLTGSSCWRNSPQARAAIERAIVWAGGQKS